MALKNMAPDEEAEFRSYITRFKEHDAAAEEQYTTLNEVFQGAVIRSKKSVSMNAGLRDMAEITRSLSSLRGDSLKATGDGFNALRSLHELDLKREKNNVAANDTEAVSLFMRDFSNSLRSSGMVDNLSRADVASGHAATPDNISRDLLRQRQQQELSQGGITLTNNEQFMKYDFQGCAFKYSPQAGTTVAVDTKTGQVIPNYPLERIPDTHKFLKIVKGMPISKDGNPIETL